MSSTPCYFQTSFSRNLSLKTLGESIPSFLRFITCDITLGSGTFIVEVYLPTFFDSLKPTDEPDLWFKESLKYYSPKLTPQRVTTCDSLNRSHRIVHQRVSVPYPFYLYVRLCTWIFICYGSLFNMLYLVLFSIIYNTYRKQKSFTHSRP